MPSDKRIKTHNILSLVKLGSIIVICLIIIINNSRSSRPLVYYSFPDAIAYMLELFLTLIISVLYYTWSYVLYKRINPKYANVINTIESILFLLIFMSFIWITGKHESYYKIIFLFIIIPVSIQFGFKYGFITACISSLYLMLLDYLVEPNQPFNSYLENDIIIAFIFILISWLLSHYVKIEKNHSTMLEYKANTDGLTGLNNHRYFYEQLESKYADDVCNLSLIFFDIDYFKDYNDLFGHLKGDGVLKSIGSKLKELFNGEEATIARYGGDEFAIILCNKTKEQTRQIGEKIRSTIEEMYFEGQEQLSSKNLTVSIGIAFNDDYTNEYLDIVKRADDALYKAKFTRKNQVEVFSSVYNMIITNMKEEQFDLIASIETLLCVINTKDKYTYGHVERVVRYVKMMADKLKLSNQDKEKLIYGAYTHDIGKINIPTYILNKKTPLTNDEWELIKHHPDFGVEIINQIDSLSCVVPLVKHHHERYDGNGYPSQLKGTDIPYFARILTIADCFDAMTFSRPYKSAMTNEEAIAELRRCSGTQFDPDLTKVFIEVIKEK